jgi:hypothetical protein
MPPDTKPPAVVPTDWRSRAEHWTSAEVRSAIAGLAGDLRGDAEMLVSDARYRSRRAIDGGVGEVRLADLADAKARRALRERDPVPEPPPLDAEA